MAVLASGRARPTPEISTFHSLCVRILRRNIRRLGYPDRFAIYDRGDQESLARQALRDIHVGHETLRPGDLLYWIGGWKSQGVLPEQAEHLATRAKHDKPLLAALAYDKYQAALRAAGAVDFDDLLLLTDRVLSECPDVERSEAARFDHLLIDEYQDTNALQYRIARRLAQGHRNLCVVGDDDQSICGWRGAEVTHILNFARDWPEARVIKLEENHRCCAPVLELANTLIARNRTRHDKTLRPARQGGEPPRFLRSDDDQLEAQTVAQEVRLLLDGTPTRGRVGPRDVAILFRTTEQTRAFEVELRRVQVPYVVVGATSFYDRREVKDTLAYLRVLANPSDELSLLRVINCPPRGIGALTVERLLQRAVAAGKPLWDVLGATELADTGIADVTAARIARFCSMIAAYTGRLATEPIGAVLPALVDEVRYRAELERLYPKPGEAEARFAAVEGLVNAAARYEQSADAPSLLGFLDECTLGGRAEPSSNKDGELDKNAVALMTLHSAKGLEFPHVFLVGLEEGILPHQRSVLQSDGGGVEEERRLCYVGITRARDTLTLTRARARMKWGKLRPCVPSRFLLEMRGDDERAKKAVEAARALLAREQEPSRGSASAPEKGARATPPAPKARRRSCASTRK